MTHKNVEKTESTAPMLPKEKKNLKIKLQKTPPNSFFEKKSPTPLETPNTTSSTLTLPETPPKEKANLKQKLTKLPSNPLFKKKSPTAPPETPNTTSSTPLEEKPNLLKNKTKLSKEMTKRLWFQNATPNSLLENKLLAPNTATTPPTLLDENPNLPEPDKTKEQKLPKTSLNESKPPTLPVTPPGNGGEKMVMVTPNSNGMGKFLIREDTILANLQGCAGCGRGQFTCAGMKKQMSVLCWGRPSDRKYYCLLVLLSATFAFSLIGTIFFCFTNTLNDAILSNMVIRNNSLAYSVWKRPNVQPLMKVHIFNYTNWREVRARQNTTLIVKEAGPYVYSQQLERVHVKFEGDRLSYKERSLYRYLPEKTVGAHFDQLDVPNLPMLGLASMAKTLTIDLGALNMLPSFPGFPTFRVFNHPDAFVKLPVHRFLWGYDDSIFDIVKPILMFQGKLKFERFGLLVMKNVTESDSFTINTGENDMDKMNIIEKVDGKSHLNYWNDRECNKIDGTDGSIFPPSMLDKNQTLYIFNPYFCRRLPFVFEKEIEINDGIILYRYRMPSNVFDDPSRNSANQCYCDMDAGVCPPQGVISVSACTVMGVPAMVSFPHFFRGDPRLRAAVQGMRPDPALHDTYVDIHPKLGITLQGRSTIQINMQVKKSNVASAVSYLPEGLILPVAWIEVGVEELPESLKSLVYHGTYSTAAVQLGLTVICVLALIISSICLLLMMMQRRKKPCATLKKVAVEVKEGMGDS